MYIRHIYKFIYNLLINKRAENKRTNLGNIYFEKIYINKTIMAKANTTWFIKQNGTNWGIIYNIIRIITSIIVIIINKNFEFERNVRKIDLSAQCV